MDTLTKDQFIEKCTDRIILNNKVYSYSPQDKKQFISDLDQLISSAKLDTAIECDSAILDIETPSIATAEYQKKCFAALDKINKAIRNK